MVETSELLKDLGMRGILRQDAVVGFLRRDELCLDGLVTHSERSQYKQVVPTSFCCS